MGQRLQIMSVTPTAAARVAEIMARADKPVLGLRIGVDKGGCAGMSYTMELTDALKPGDEIVDAGEGKVIVDAKAVLYLLGARMDFEASKLRSGFTFNNPNQTSACGCGESVALTPAAASVMRPAG